MGISYFFPRFQSLHFRHPFSEMQSTQWSPWRAVNGIAPLAPRVFVEILDGGQSFRWFRLTDAPLVYQGIWSDNVAQLSLDKNGRLRWRAPAAIAKRVGAAFPRYLAVGTDFDALTDALPWRRDARLASAIEAFRGVRILRQPFGEVLLGFICSAMKRIPHIKQMLALLAERHGTDILSGCREFRRLPTWAELGALTEEQLRACKLGFRARHVWGTARFLAERPAGWLAETEALPYPAARERLMLLPGVGEKVADCVLLFGAGRYEAFPVDTWIRRVLREDNRLASARAHYGSGAGLANAYLFAHARDLGA